jgi:hypothetical protein
MVRLPHERWLESYADRVKQHSNTFSLRIVTTNAVWRGIGSIKMLPNPLLQHLEIELKSNVVEG